MSLVSSTSDKCLYLVFNVEQHSVSGHFIRNLCSFMYLHVVGVDYIKNISIQTKTSVKHMDRE